MSPGERRVLEFIASRLESMLRRPAVWGALLSVEERILQLLELRRVLLVPLHRPTTRNDSCGRTRSSSLASSRTRRPNRSRSSSSDEVEAPSSRASWQGSSTQSSRRSSSRSAAVRTRMPPPTGPRRSMPPRACSSPSAWMPRLGRGGGRSPRPSRSTSLTRGKADGRNERPVPGRVLEVRRGERWRDRRSPVLATARPAQVDRAAVLAHPRSARRPFAPGAPVDARARGLPAV